ncbi:exonuclease SbcCD subunit D C-terminal domain-containing protein [Halopseudomonas formosensis]|uniref:Nuclease SbcCD subunit D n=1 Tax=Halopseudomonas formosensis TaxID=1002526 RepID=A0ABU5C056_9GAMM|nr:exonuclease SbcCD subunit D C-terminal domain-containing protein [Halopseudomonas formosensis]MDX9688425.1 exonuclease SbcCD subunit D C-terminal domain-containing protein [Halopseudomonas formosensis]
MMQSAGSLRLLHTSDWHLGRTLYGRRRYGEFEAFLDWLAETLRQQCVDVLLVAGDIFDTTAPSNRAQQLYYRFLCQAANAGCRHVVIVAGNHDSPSFLTAPQELLRAMNVHVVGSTSEDIAEQVLTLQGPDGEPELIVCAVPYLRDRDIRQAAAGESVADKERKLQDGIREHYDAVARLAEDRRTELGAHLPIVATGHLFTAGGQTIEGDGVRELYVGSLAHVHASLFSPSFDYVALGHLHVPQKVNDSEHIRYSGSPLPMGFGEARQRKSLCLVDLAVQEGQRQTGIELLEIPVFQRLERITGDWPAIAARLAELVAVGSDAWLEIIYQGEEIVSDLRERLDKATEGSAMEILRVKNSRIAERVLGRMHEQETLDELDEQEVFERCLDQHEVSEEQRADLRHAYREVLQSIHEDDAGALGGTHG